MFARMAGTFKAINADDIDSDTLGRQRVAHCHTFVNHLDPGSPERFHEWLGRTPCGFDQLDSAFDDDADILAIVDRRRDNAYGYVDSKRLAGQRLATGNFFAQTIGGFARQRGHYAQPTCIGNGGGKIRCADPHHAPADDRRFNFQQFSQSGFHWVSPNQQVRNRVSHMIALREKLWQYCAIISTQVK